MPSSSGRAGANREFEAHIAANINSGVSEDGRLEVAEAIAMTSQKVSVDISTVPFTISPPNLFDLTFNDPNVAIDDEFLMRSFKAQLEKKLSTIAASIEQNVPANPALEIELVAQFVSAALASGGSQS